MQGFVNHNPKPYALWSRQQLSKHPLGPYDALLLTGLRIPVWTRVPDSVLLLRTRLGRIGKQTLG